MNPVPVIRGTHHGNRNPRVSRIILHARARSMYQYQWKLAPIYRLNFTGSVFRFTAKGNVPNYENKVDYVYM